MLPVKLKLNGAYEIQQRHVVMLQQGYYYVRAAQRIFFSSCLGPFDVYHH